MRVADLLAQELADSGLRRVFMVTGGGAMHLNDALGRNPMLDVVCCHHEQACSMAAESYARTSNLPAAVNVTSGPGGINALNGVFGAFVDSIPMIVISGQVKRETLVSSYALPLRQLGDQEVDIVAMARPVCKDAILLADPQEARYEIQRALWLARAGRPGPVWIDVPIDVQSAPVDPDSLRRFDPQAEGESAMLPAERGAKSGGGLEAELEAALVKLGQSERPVLLVGAGVRLAGAHDLFLRVADKLGIPVATGWNAHDAVWNNHPLYVGRPGTVGDRAGNFAVQNADFLLVLGSRLNIRQVSYNWQAFARAAFVVMVDADAAELAKPTLSVDLPVQADLAEALQMLEDLTYTQAPAHGRYLAWCRERVARYPVVLDEYAKRSDPVNPYVFVQKLFDELDEDDIVVTGDGTACVVTFQAAELKKGQRLFTNSGSASMGYDLPAAIGAWCAAQRRVICLAGDGSIMMNLQELQTIVGRNMDIKVIVLKNDGYSSIRQTQENYFPDNVVGCGPESGLTFPDFVRLGDAIGFATRRCSSHLDLSEKLRETISSEGPQLLEVVLDPEQPFSPKLSSRQLEDGSMVSSPLEDLAPFLSRGELAENMLIPVVEE
jgi:acetolactate synthase I/II/III large subunit